MTDGLSLEGELKSIVWNNWSVVRKLADVQYTLRTSFVEALVNQLQDELGTPSEAMIADDQIAATVAQNGARDGVLVKFFLGNPDLGRGIGNVSASILAEEDGPLTVWISADLPQKKIAGMALEEARKFIEEQVENAPGNGITRADLERNPSRNGLCARTAKAERADNQEPDLGDFVDRVASAVLVFRQIANWFAAKQRDYTPVAGADEDAG